MILEREMGAVGNGVGINIGSPSPGNLDPQGRHLPRS